MNAKVKNGTAILTMHIKGPRFTVYASELENYIKKLATKKKFSKMNNKQYQNFLLEKSFKFYLQLVKRNDLYYMENNIKVYVKKYPNTWELIQDYIINNAIFKYLGFVFHII